MPAAMKNPQQFERSLDRVHCVSGRGNVGAVSLNLVDQPAAAPDRQADVRFVQCQTRRVTPK